MTQTDVGFTLDLYYSGSSYIRTRCNRWDVQDYNLVVEMWMKKNDLLNLMSNIRPGAIRELKRVVYAPKFYDATYSGKNTVQFKPVTSEGLYAMRGVQRGAFVKSITSSPLPGSSSWISVKLECSRSGSTL